MSCIYLNIYGLKISVSSNCLKFSSIVRENFNYFLSEESGDCDLVVDFRYSRNLFRKESDEPLPSMALVGSTGSRVYVGHGLLYVADFNIPGLNIIINTSGGRYSLKAAYRLTKKDIVLMRGVTTERLLKIARYIIHYPLFQLMREKQQLSFLHASAIENNGKGYVFFGLPGAGKTRCIMELLEKGGFKFLSDNYILCSENKGILAFPELVRISGNGGELKINRSSFFKKVDSGNRQTKSLFNVNRENISERAGFSKVFLLKRSPVEKLEKLETADFISSLIAVEKFTKDFYEYSYIDLLRLSGLSLAGLFSDRRLELSRILKDADCYELSVKENSHGLRLIKEIV